MVRRSCWCQRSCQAQWRCMPSFPMVSTVSSASYRSVRGNVDRYYIFIIFVLLYGSIRSIWTTTHCPGPSDRGRTKDFKIISIISDCHPGAGGLLWDTDKLNGFELNHLSCPHSSLCLLSSQSPARESWNLHTSGSLLETGNWDFRVQQTTKLSLNLFLLAVDLDCSQ